MQKLIIIYALLACSLAAPLEKSKETEEPSKPVGLNRPSPINPDIPSDPKPEEKITLITDPKVLPLATTKPTRLPGPYVLPRELLLRTKRENKDSSESKENSSEEKKKPSRPLVASPASSIEKQPTKPSSKPVLSSSTHPSNEAHISGAVPSTTSVTIPAHPRIPYSPQIHQHNEHLFKPTTASAHSSGTSSTSSSTTARAVPSQDHVNDKRDIPVPLTRKFHHNDEEDDETKPKEEPSPSSTSSSSTKVPKEEVKQEEEKDEGHKAEPVAASTTTNQQQHPATIARPIPVAELFAKKPSTE